MKLSLLLSSALALCATALSASAQTLYTINGPAATVVEQAGPGFGPCGYPNGPLVSSFPTVVPYGCAVSGVFAAPPAIIGDVAVARGANLVYATDGAIVTAYTPAGVAVNSFPIAPALPGFGLVTGMGYDGITGILWISSAVAAAGIFPPPSPGCLPPAVAVPPFALPAAGAPYTDIDWDPSTGSLFLCGVPGLIANVLPGGAPGPFGMYAPAMLCVGPPFYGLALDHAAAGATATMYLTNGGAIERTALPGTPVLPTFYSPAVCFAAAAPPISGLAFSAHSISYGVSVPAAGPALSGIGQSITPNPGFGVRMSGAVPGSFAVVYYHGAFSCPAIPFGPNLIYIGLVPPPIVLGSGVVSGAGTLTLPAPIPPAMPIPGSLFLQGFDIVGASIQNTPGMEISFTRP